MRTNLKATMRDAIRSNREASAPHDPDVVRCVGNMWYNPKMPRLSDSDESDEEALPTAGRKCHRLASPAVRQCAAGRLTRRAAAAAIEEEPPPSKRLAVRRRGRRTQVLTARVAALLRSPMEKDKAAATSVVKGRGDVWRAVRSRI